MRLKTNTILFMIIFAQSCKNFVSKVLVRIRGGTKLGEERVNCCVFKERENTFSIALVSKQHKN